MSKSKNSAIETHDSTGDNEQYVSIEWSIENESILVEWCDVAQCYRWLHMCSNRKYNTMHMYFTIPTITLSTITGTASFAQASLPQDYQAWASMAIGAVNIFIGIITTIQQYLKVSELNEAHRVSALSWDKYARNIRIELAKAPAERTDARSFLKVCRQEFDRLMETSPSIPLEIVNKFKRTFKGRDGSLQREVYNDLKKPDILDIIISSDINRHHWYKSKERENPDLYGRFNSAASDAYPNVNLKKYSGDSEDNTYFNFKNLAFNPFKRSDSNATTPEHKKRSINVSREASFFDNVFDIENAQSSTNRPIIVPINTNQPRSIDSNTLKNDFIPKPNISANTSISNPSNSIAELYVENDNVNSVLTDN